MRIEPVLGNITEQRVDAIVNAANSRLSGGGGVDGAIHRAAGIEDMHEACTKLGGCSVGDAKFTPGFRLPAKWVIHTVGPIYKDGRSGESQRLASCYIRSCELAESLGVRSLAFPAISTGVYGYPLDEAANVAIMTLRTFSPKSLELVRLVAFNSYTFNLYKHRLEGRLYWPKVSLWNLCKHIK